MSFDQFRESFLFGVRLRQVTLGFVVLGFERLQLPELGLQLGVLPLERRELGLQIFVRRARLGHVTFDFVVLGFDGLQNAKFGLQVGVLRL